MKIHFIGIGGIGISALARLAASRGFEVSGSDIQSSYIIEALKKEGMNIVCPHDPSVIKDQDLVVHSAIITQENAEIKEAARRGIKILSRQEALFDFLKDYKVYSVCGAHGKSTTTAILASILKKNALIGAISKEFGSNAVFSPGEKTLVFEADESDGSFIHSNPYCAVVTNAEPEHMEHYDYDEQKFYAHYREFLDKATRRVINCADPFLAGLNTPAQRLYPQDVKNVELKIINGEPYTSFELQDLGSFSVWGFGEHIAADAALAILAALEEMDLKTIRQNLKDFKGIKKRFDIIKNDGKSIVIDDYAHHPTEIRATLKSALAFAAMQGINGVKVIWQPHKYSRLLDNLDGFKACFKGASKLIILPVWEPGNTKADVKLQEHFKSYKPIFAASVADVASELQDGLTIGFGAGDITSQLRTAI